MEDDIKRWKAGRRSALVQDSIQGNPTVAEASRSYDPMPSEFEQWIGDAKRGMGSALHSNPLDSTNAG